MSRKRKPRRTGGETVVEGRTVGTTSANASDLSREAFRTFMKNRRPQPAKAIPAAASAPMKPTHERLTKDDRPHKTPAGFYRSPGPIERLRNRGKLDPTPHINEAMHLAAVKLYTHFYEAGLGGISAQDVSRICGGGSGDGGSCGFPKTERAIHNRYKFRDACRAMGWFPAYPHRGAGRLVVDVICFEMSVKDAAAIHIPGGGNEANLAAGMDRLKEGLFTLASLWKLF